MDLPGKCKACKAHSQESESRAALHHGNWDPNPNCNLNPNPNPDPNLNLNSKPNPKSPRRFEAKLTLTVPPVHLR